ncbi:tyrosine-type recombinase/integrase [Marinobacterium sediminicola]|uniref:Site-specific recombinase XerD n=1 Tax=Marinobacterium sediminicola TaxID=518898 RepID=A0ABY1S2V9_9GAMM|nr:site-specific integrase [Marinobacterium sediminicola]ULG70728.1 site-specific integrase [Marinobacterium sediminicola]SMR77335.1 Site-specific recombinase XerD [Marinobacterium sediminicola]
MEIPAAIPLFDTVDELEDGNARVNEYLTGLTLHRLKDAAVVYEYTVDWLLEQRGNENNFKTYRSELTTFLYWCFEIEHCSPLDITRRSLFRYVEFCRHPPETLIAYYNSAQFKTDKETGDRYPNPAWRPFLGRRQDGLVVPYRLSEQALRTKLAILSSYYGFLIDEELTERNPARQILKSGAIKAGGQFLAEGEGYEQIKAFSELQWSYVMGMAHKLAKDNPQLHERTLFLVSLMYGCYLRISEVAARPGFAPIMGQFRRDGQTGIWSYHIPRSKGGKQRSVAVSKDLLRALKRYRKHLGLSDLPPPGDETPLFIRHRAAGRGRDAGIQNANLGIRQIRELLDELFERASLAAEQDGFDEDAAAIREMTPHSLRHTGITHDINLNQRPLSHVQADAGHDSIDTTSRYLHTSRVERHESAAGKKLDRLQHAQDKYQASQD